MGERPRGIKIPRVASLSGLKTLSFPHTGLHYDVEWVNIMGERNRRRLLDPNFGKPKFFGDSRERETGFFSKKLDILIVNSYQAQKRPELFEHFFEGASPENRLNSGVLACIEAEENPVRNFLNKNKKLIVDALSEAATEHSSGYILGVSGRESNQASFYFIPNNQLGLGSLAEIYGFELGKEVSRIMEFALRSYSWSDASGGLDRLRVPVLAVSADKKVPSWLFLM